MTYNHEVLEVRRDATAAEVKSAYRRLARTLHPDVCTDPEATERFQDLGVAFRCMLEDLEVRAGQPAAFVPAEVRPAKPDMYTRDCTGVKLSRTPTRGTLTNGFI